MTTKEQLLQYFSGLDISTLQKLKKYSQLLIIPDEDLLTNATMSQMVDKAHNLADALFPEWTDRSKSDFGEFLVELFAVFSEKDFWYINAFANEGILKKMRSYSNAFSKASSMGYTPTLCKGSTCNFSVQFQKGQEVTYDRGELIIDVGGLKFTNDERFVVSSSSAEVSKQLLLHEGDHIAEDFTYNGYNVFIRKANVDIESIKVVVDNISYSRVNNFGFSSADSTHFMVLPEEDGSCSVHFGNGGFGVQPSIGKSIHVEYRICSGAEGNLEISDCSVVDSLSEREALSVTMLSSATGGHYGETLTSIKEKAPLCFNSKRAAINETISESILCSFPFVHQAKVEVLGRDVVYRIIPNTGFLEPTRNELSQIAEDFHPLLMTGYFGVYSENSYQDILKKSNPMASQIILDVIVLSGYDLGFIESSLRQIMDDLTNPLIKATYGGSFNKTQADILMRSNVTGVQSVAFKILVDGIELTMPDVFLEPTEIFKPIEQENLIVRTHVV